MTQISGILTFSSPSDADAGIAILKTVDVAVETRAGIHDELSDAVFGVARFSVDDDDEINPKWDEINRLIGAYGFLDDVGKGEPDLSKMYSN
jgi:hypothetical protein